MMPLNRASLFLLVFNDWSWHTGASGGRRGAPLIARRRRDSIPIADARLCAAKALPTGPSPSRFRDDPDLCGYGAVTGPPNFTLVQSASSYAALRCWVHLLRSVIRATAIRRWSLHC